MKNTVNDQKFAGKLSAADKSAIEKATADTISWLEDHADAEKVLFLL
jgi:hypothetical protein